MTCGRAKLRGLATCRFRRMCASRAAEWEARAAARMEAAEGDEEEEEEAAEEATGAGMQDSLLCFIRT